MPDIEATVKATDTGEDPHYHPTLGYLVAGATIIVPEAEWSDVLFQEKEA